MKKKCYGKLSTTNSPEGKWLSTTSFVNDDDNLWFNFKIDEINVLFEYLEKGIQYNFEGADNKCKNKYLKKKDDDIGSGALELLIGGMK